MKLHSLGRRTDLIFSKFSGTVYDRGSYTVVKTPSNPGYHWGNYLIFDRAPKVGDLQIWKNIFDSEFEYYKEPHHYVFAWDTGKVECGEYNEFEAEGFEFDSGVVLVGTNLNKPPQYNQDIEIRKIQSDSDWESVIKLQIHCADPKYLNDYYENFKRKQFTDYRQMTVAGMGYWFGAFVGQSLVGDLGIFFEKDVGRYQNVETHPDYRRKGICGTLVYETGQIAFKEYGVEYLVMEVDLEYHAARIYESVGFKPKETNHSLSWWKGSK